jgi:hypothetical protein
VTVDEWGQSALLLLRRWPGQALDSDVLDTWGELLADLPGPAVHAAVRAIALTSRQFAPNPGDIREKAADLAAPPVTFEQAWSEIHRAISAAGRYDSGKAEVMLRQVPGGWDLVLALGGWDEICHGGPIEQTPMPAGVRRAAGEHAWKALREQRRTDVAAAPLPGLAGDVARERLQGDAVQRIAVPPEPDGSGAVPQLAARPSAPQMLALAAAAMERSAANPKLKPEYRAALEDLLRAGEKIPERWLPFVDEVKAAMGLAG